MSIFIRGLDPSLGRSISNAGASVKQLRRSPVEVEPTLGFFSALDLGLAVQVILSLFVLILTYDAMSGEKEGGTLRLVSSLPVSKDQLLLGKFFGVLIPTLTAFGLPLLLGIAVVLGMSDVQMTGTGWWRLGIILAASGLYLTVLICAGLLASCLTHRPATSFVLLLTFWVATVVVVPRLSLIAADHFRPAISNREYQAEKHLLLQHYMVKRRDLREQWQKEHSPPGQEWWRTPEGREAQILSDFQRREELAKHRDQELSHKAALRYLLRQDVSSKYGEPKWDISDMPRFAYQEAWPEEDVQLAFNDIGVLTLWGIVFFVGAYVAMLRYDLR